MGWRRHANVRHVYDEVRRYHRKSGEGAFLAPSRIRRFVVLVRMVGTKRLFHESAPSSPLTLALSPNPITVGGEGRHGRELRLRAAATASAAGGTLG